MANSKTRLTLPEIMRALNEKRSTIERLVRENEWRIGPPERAGIIRTWPADTVETLRVVLEGERRVREQPL